MNESDLKLIGSRIRAARVEQKMSQAELAEKSNMSLPRISEIELGKSNMKIESFVRIIEVLHVSADSILRADVPVVAQLYNKELDDLFSDCTPAEREAILNVARSVKSSLRSTNNKDEY